MSGPALTVAPLTKFVPVSVTEIVDPAPPDEGLRAVSVGWAGLIVNDTAGDVPPAVVTVTFAVPRAAFAAIAKVAVICVALTTTTLLTVMSGPALTVAPLTKFEPVSVTG